MGWRFKKRPGLDYFLQQCAQNGYEIVIFSVESAQVCIIHYASQVDEYDMLYIINIPNTFWRSGMHLCLKQVLANVFNSFNFIMIM